MDRGQPQHLGRAGPIWVQRVMQVNALETLEQPAQRRASGRFTELIGYGLPRRG